MWPLTTSSPLAFIYFLSFTLITCEYQHRPKNSHEMTNLSKNDVFETINYNGKINDCHKVALWNCGNSLLKVSKFLDYLSGKEENIYAKCTMKKAFYNCLNEMSSKKCGHHRDQRTHDNKTTNKFRKKLARTLWSARSCYIAPFFANQWQTWTVRQQQHE
ncbi:uncharacterized protein LOC128386066 [Panonychus citri]|uniref:uncharacterized protein LOC128386066 n=1 Tax=Panonychus citri TaxID=50023 RepID=UPI002307086F|nr:uncharacterized protein LOC128386066 [Panonychus citri]